MNGGDLVIGGNQAAPVNSPQPTPGPQPVLSATPVLENIPPSTSHQQPIIQAATPSVSSPAPSSSVPTAKAPQLQTPTTPPLSTPQPSSLQPPAQNTPTAAPVTTAPAVPRQYPTLPTPTATISQPAYQDSGDIVLPASAPAPKSKLKKALIIGAIVVAIISIILGVVVVLPSILAGPQQEFTKNDYSEFNNQFQPVNNLADYIKNGLNDEVSVYYLLFHDYIADKDDSLNTAINNTYYTYGLYSTSSALDNAAPYIPEFQNTIENIAHTNYGTAINSQSRQILPDISAYSERLTYFVNEISAFRAAFIAQNQDELNKFYERNNVSEDTQMFITWYGYTLQQIEQTISDCDALPNKSECQYNITDIVDLDNAVYDVQRVSNLFESVIGSDNVSMIVNTSNDINNLSQILWEQVNER